MAIESSKFKQLLSYSLVSGSSDRIRTSLGGFWSFVSSSRGSAYEYESFDRDSPVLGYFKQVRANTDSGYIEVVDPERLMYNVKLPLRIYGSAETVENDEMWKAVFMGGTYAGESYNAVYGEGEHEYNYVSWQQPYTAYEGAQILSSSGQLTDTMQITYEYNRYTPLYQNFAADVKTELQLPNYYFLTDLSTYDLSGDDGDLFDSELKNFVTIENEYEDLSNLFTMNMRALSAEQGIRTAEDMYARCASEAGYDYSYLSTLYLTGTVPRYDLSASTAEYAEIRFRNILFDNKALRKLYVEDTIDRKTKYLPYYIKINIPMEEQGRFGLSIQQNKYTSKFIKNLYKTFGTPPSNRYYMSLQESYEVNPENTSELLYNREAAGSTYAAVNYPAFLADCYNNYSSSMDRCIFAGENNASRLSAAGEDSLMFRYLNSMNCTSVISDMVNFYSSSVSFNGFLNNFYGNEESNQETLAYRVEKSLHGIPIQDYWFWNPGKLTVGSSPSTTSSPSYEINFYDTQVKYDQAYKYRVYAYKLVRGFKYKYSDLILTKQIGCDIEEGRYGLEFYDPKTDERAEQLYSTEDGRLQKLSDLVTMAQTTSTYPYLADMYIQWEPHLQIIQVPIMSKEVRIRDNWPAKPTFQPYQIIDASQTIGFEITLGDHFDKVYESGLNGHEDAERNAYLLARDILPDEKVIYPTVSEPRYVEIYRTTERPLDVTSFEGKLLRTLDLKLENSKYSYKTDFFENTIRTNQKYYYIFRVLNEQSIPGHLSDICEAELVDDGGYLYAVFNIFTREQLEIEEEPQPSKGFKKLLQFRPAINQTDFDDSEVDYTLNAGAGMQKLGVGTADDLIWDKTFKIRLTSKKTGKKIDLNITYKLDSEY